MADIRPNELLRTAESMAEDDYLLLDGATEGTRKIAANAAVNAAQIDVTNGASGAVPRSLRSKLSETLSVADFGAVGDGETNDRAALAAALTNGESFTIGGTVLIATPVTPGDEIKIEGGAIYQSVFEENVFNLLAGGNDFYLKNLTIEYSLPVGWDFASGPNGVGINGPGPGQAPRSFDFFEHVTFINSNKQAYADFNGSNNARIVNSRVLNSGRAGVVVSGQNFGTYVAGCVMENTGDDAIAFNGDSSHCIGIGNVLKNVGLVGPATGIPHNLIAAGSAFKVHGKHITIVGNAIKDVYTAFLSVKPNNNNSVDGLNSPEHIIFANNACEGLYQALDGASSSVQCGVQTMTGNATRAVKIGGIVVAHNTFKLGVPSTGRNSFFRNRHPTRHVELTGNIVQEAFRLFSIEDHLDTLTVRGGEYEYSDWALRVANDTTLVKKIELDGGVYRRTGSGGQFALIVDDVDVDELVFRGLRIYGNIQRLIRLNGEAHIDTIRLEDCLLNGNPFYVVDTLGTSSYDHLFINGVEHITTVASAAAGDGNTTLVTGAEFGKRYAIKIDETVAFNGDTSNTFRLGTSAGDDSLFAPVTATGSAQGIAYVDGAGQNIVLSWTNNASASAGELTATIKVTR